MYGIVLALTVTVLIILGLLSYLRKPVQDSIVCPLSAVESDEGQILVQPGNLLFNDKDEYRKHYKKLEDQGVKCEKVQPFPVREKQAADSKKHAGTTKNIPVDGSTTEHPYNTEPIRKLDDYEYTRVMSVERGSRTELEKTTVNALTALRQFDWSQLPFNSDFRATFEQWFNGKRMEGFTDTLTEPFFAKVSGESMSPPDLDEIESAEMTALQTYRPKKTEDLMQHDLDDVTELVKKAYADGKWDPVVEARGGNQFEVVGLKPRPAKEDVKYADETVPTIKEAMQNGEISGDIQPKIAMSGSEDPYFDKRGVLDYEGDRFYRYENFGKWAPGLERMFAPTFDQNDWIGEAPEK